MDKNFLNMGTSTNVTDTDTSQISKWFDEFIGQLRVDELMLTTGTAPKAKDELYKSLMANDLEKISFDNRRFSTQYFISKLLTDYLSALFKFNTMPQKLAFDLSDSKILVWAEINDDDEVTEDALIMAEAKANATYFGKGFFVNSTIVEKSDNISVPVHYNLFIGK